MSQFEVGGGGKNPVHQLEDSAFQEASKDPKNGIYTYNALRLRGYETIIAALVVAAVVTGLTWRMQ